MRAAPARRLDRVRRTMALVTGLRALRLLWSYARATLAHAWRHRIFGLSAEAGFWQLLSLPSFLFGLLGIIGYLGGPLGHSTLDRIEAAITTQASRILTPATVDSTIKPALDEVLHSGKVAVISVGFAISLWSGSSAVATFVNQIALAYDQRDLRGALRSRLLALGLYVVALLFGVVALPLIVVGPTYLGRLSAVADHPNVAEAVHDLYYPGVGLVVLAGLSALYWVSPPKRPRWVTTLPGALTAAVLWIGGASGLRTYVSYVFHRTLSSALAAPIAVLIFFYVTAFAILLGAELSAEVSRRRSARVPGLSSERGADEPVEPAIERPAAAA